MSSENSTTPTRPSNQDILQKLLQIRPIQTTTSTKSRPTVVKPDAISKRTTPVASTPTTMSEVKHEATNLKPTEMYSAKLGNRSEATKTNTTKVNPTASSISPNQEIVTAKSANKPLLTKKNSTSVPKTMKQASVSSMSPATNIPFKAVDVHKSVAIKEIAPVIPSSHKK